LRLDYFELTIFFFFLVMVLLRLVVWKSHFPNDLICGLFMVSLRCKNNNYGK